MKLERGYSDNSSQFNFPGDKSYYPRELNEVKKAIAQLKKDDNNEVTLSPEDFRNLTKSVYEGMKNIFSSQAVRECTDSSEVNTLYHYFLGQGESLVVRREDPERVLNLFDKEQQIEVTPANLAIKNYPNSALFGGSSQDISGLENAFSEGFGASGGVVVTIGFHTNAEKMTILELPEEDTIRGDRQRHNVRLFSGSISLKDLAFVVMRIPSSFKDASSTKDFYSFSGFIFNEDSQQVKDFFDKKTEALYKRAS